VGCAIIAFSLLASRPAVAQGWDGFVTAGVAAISGANALDEKGTEHLVGIGILHSLFTPQLAIGGQLDLFPQHLLYGGARLGLVGQYRVHPPERRVQPFVSAGAFAVAAGRPIVIGAGVDLLATRSVGFRIMVQDFFGYVVYEPFDCVYFGYGADCRSRGIGARRAGWVHDPALQLGMAW
jgi:hypothetical protein